MVISSLVSESNGGFNPTDRNWKVKRGLDEDDGWHTLTIVLISKRDFKSFFFSWRRSGCFESVLSKWSAPIRASYMYKWAAIELNIQNASSRNRTHSIIHHFNHSAMDTKRVSEWTRFWYGFSRWVLEYPCPPTIKGGISYVVPMDFSSRIDLSRSAWIKSCTPFLGLVKGASRLIDPPF